MAVRSCLWFWGPIFMLVYLRMACGGRELASLSWCGRKSLLLLGQLYTFCFLVCQSIPDIDVNASLRSDDKSLTTAYVREFQNFSTRKSALSWSRFGVNLALNHYHKLVLAYWQENISLEFVSNYNLKHLLETKTQPRTWQNVRSPFMT